MLRVAITRAQPEADRTAERVRARGAEAIVAPLLTIVPCGYDTSTSGAQAIIFTSTNGVRAFPDARGARERLVLAVGDATANAAREAGFINVRSADGDANARRSGQARA
jgi:uroporphyrinogen-III synthase